MRISGRFEADHPNTVIEELKKHPKQQDILRKYYELSGFNHNDNTCKPVSKRLLQEQIESKSALQTVIKNNYIEFPEGNEGIVSVFAHKDNADGVSESGLLYELDNATLSPDYPLGVSNEFTGNSARISVTNGSICIMWESANNKYTIGGCDE